MQIIFIGGGNMAEAIFAKLEKLTTDIVVVQRNIDKRTILAKKYSYIRFLPELDFIPDEEDIIILAVKPQDAKEACGSLPEIKGMIVSVMAGISTTTLSAWLNNLKIVRVMSNTPANLGLGASGIYFPESISVNQRQAILDIMSCVGKTYIFDSEIFIERITPVAASSPAYVFYFIEAMIDAAVEQFGFTPEEARDITLQVFKGSLAMVEANPDTPIQQLRANVTSKKGTTEQAINYFDKLKLKQIIADAEVACYNRARELGTLFN